jgi:hypothetical protein
MLRLALLVYLLAAPFSLEIGGGLDPDGLNSQPPAADAGDISGGWDPNGAKVPSGDIGGGLDPNG